MRSLLLSLTLSALVGCAGAASPTRTTAPRAQHAQNAEALGHQAVVAIDAGRYDEAILLLDRALELDPGNGVLAYEKAYALYLKGEPLPAIAILEPLRAGGREPRVFQLLGNAYDTAGQVERAITVYEDGIARFPALGYLHYDLGICLANARRGGEAIAAFHAGIQAERTYPSNYLALARVYAGADEPVLALVYAESLLALAPGHKDVAELSGIVMGSYARLIERARKKVIVASDNPFVLLFGVVLAGGAGEETTPITPDYVAGVRARMLFFWTQSEETYEVPMIIGWQDQVAKAGHLEAYNHWVLGLADGSFQAWCEGGHAEPCNGFIAWFREHDFPGA